MTPAHELALYLADQGLGTFAGESGWSINVSRMPDQPDEAVCLYDSSESPLLVYDEQIRVPFVEVRVRGTNYEDVSDKAQAIFELLTQVDDNPPAGRDIEDGHYIGIWLASGFADLGRDDNDRFRISSNYRCNRQPLEVIS
jgi:hypothetical protein